jgi:UDP-N-acetylmuramate dehydrogenase
VTVSRLLGSGLLRRDVPLAPLTTYRLGGSAAWFAEPSDESELAEVLAAAGEVGEPVVVLGRGSNIVVADAGVSAVVIHLVGSFADISVGSDGIVAAGGGAPLAKVARAGVEAGRGGLEFLVGIPGSVGGAVRMNAGCLGTETADVMIDARVMDGRSGGVAVQTPGDLMMAYRFSSVAAHEIVVSARFRTEPQPTEIGLARIREVTRWRRETQPGGTLNAGSVFKNPPGDAAGRIIDALGLKGLRRGGAVVSSRHGNFFEADTRTTAQDIRDLVRIVQRRVEAATGVRLEPEVEFLGEFAETIAEGMP